MFALLALIGLVVWLWLTFILVYANHGLRNRSHTLKDIIEWQDVVIAKQRQLIEEKMTKVVEEALTTKKGRSRPRKS